MIGALFLLILSTAVGTVEITKIESEAGYVMIESEPISVIRRYNKIIHVFDLEDIRATIQKVKIEVSKNFLIKQGEMLVGLQDKIKELEHLLSTITIHTRNKRGLLNFGGRTIKWLFGNMDDEDKEMIDAHFAKIDMNQQQLIGNLNKQIKINTDIQKFMQNVHLLLESNRLLFNASMSKEIIDNIPVIKYNSYWLIINQIRDKIERIQENILMARYNVMNRFVLTNDEIDLYNIDSSKLRHLKFNIGSLSNDVIIFVISVPEFFNKMYITNYIMPVPNKRAMQIDINETRIVKIENTTFIVNEENFLPKMLQPNDCIVNLIKDNYRNCSRRKFVGTVVKEIDIGNLILINVKHNLTNFCNNFTYFLNGSYFVRTEKCGIQIGDYFLRRYETKMNIVIPNFNVIPENETELLDVPQMINLDTSNEVYLKQNINYNFYAIYGLLTCIVILLVIYKKDFLFTLIRRDSNSKGGRVIYATQEEPIAQEEPMIL